jgi:hypothetical protein
MERSAPQLWVSYAGQRAKVRSTSTTAAVAHVAIGGDFVV